LSRDVLTRPAPPPDHRIAYGGLPQQFGDLRLPKIAPNQKAPLLVFLHGGWWMAEYGLEYAGHLCEALRARGVATWSLEYRRLGDAGGGWPGTFEDAAAGYDFIHTLARTYPLDLSRVVAAGHSAGGHLAFWLAGRRHVPPASILAKPQPAVPLRGVVSLAGAVDLRLILKYGGILNFSEGPEATVELMGGTPTQVPDRYRAGNPGELLPFGLPQTLVQGTEDTQIPPQVPQAWADESRRQGDGVELKIIPGADHFDLVDPQSSAWPAVEAALLEHLR
jgi:acetyl esterase/lipase